MNQGSTLNLKCLLNYMRIYALYLFGGVWYFTSPASSTCSANSKDTSLRDDSFLFGGLKDLGLGFGVQSSARNSALALGGFLRFLAALGGSR